MESKAPFRVTRRQFVTTSAAAMAAGSLAAGFVPAAKAADQGQAGQKTGGGPFRVIIDTDPGWMTLWHFCSLCVRLN